MSNHDDTMDCTQLVEIGDSTLSTGICEIFGDSEGFEEGRSRGKQKDNLFHFADFEEWIMFLMLIGMKHAKPEATDLDVINYTSKVARKMTSPDNLPMWRKARTWVERFGMRQATVRVMLELQRTAEER